MCVPHSAESRQVAVPGCVRQCRPGASQSRDDHTNRQNAGLRVHGHWDLVSDTDWEFEREKMLACRILPQAQALHEMRPTLGFRLALAGPERDLEDVHCDYSIPTSLIWYKWAANRSCDLRVKTIRPESRSRFGGTMRTLSPVELGT